MDLKSGVLQTLAIISGSLGLATLIPTAQASKISVLGYKALCTFSPVSTIILLYVSLTLFRYLRNKRIYG